MCQSTQIWLTPVVVAGIFSLAGVWLGSYLNQNNSYKLANKQRILELRNRSYAKLMGLKLPLVQAVQTNSEAKILCEYYDTRFHINADKADLDEAKKQNERALSLIKEISNLRREVSETLGDIKISFPPSTELDQAIEAVYRSSALAVPEMRQKIKSIEALEEWREKNFATLEQIVRAEYYQKIDALLTILFNQTKAHT